MNQENVSSPSWVKAHPSRFALPGSHQILFERPPSYWNKNIPWPLTPAIARDTTGFTRLHAVDWRCLPDHLGPRAFPHGMEMEVPLEMS